MEKLLNLEFFILNSIAKLSSPALDKLMVFFSTVGNAGVIWILFGITLLLFKKYRKCGAAMLISLVLCLVFGNVILKPIIARTRPFDIDKSIVLLINAPSDFSFPSGHTLAAFAVATASTYSKNKYIYITSFVFAALIAFSRLYLQVHFPTDVLAGIILGILLGYAAKKITDTKLFASKNDRP